MKSAWIAIMIALVLNVLGAVGFVGYLYGTDRLDLERLRRVAAVFEMTLEQENAAQEQAELLRQAQAKEQAEAEHLRRVAMGPQSMTDRLALMQQVSDVAAETENRRADDLRAVQRRLDQGWSELRREKEALDAERVAFEAQTRTLREQREDQAFQQAVALYESIPAKQARQQFMELIAGGRMDQVVDYLASMNKRKAVGVLSEFKGPEDVPVATELLERLRARGVLNPDDAMADMNAPGQGENR